jgi:hypothetical protein
VQEEAGRLIVRGKKSKELCKMASPKVPVYVSQTGENQCDLDEKKMFE